MRALAALAALVVTMGCTDRPRADGASSPSSDADTAPRRAVVIVALDGADWLAIDRLATRGALPVFARLRSRGRTATLVATPPLVSPIIWTTIATGREPEDHGILDFMVDTRGGGPAPVPSSDRRVAALWNLFSDAGRTAAVIGWWATWPPESIRGVMVSDRVAPQLARADAPDVESAIAPADAARRLAPHRVRPDRISMADLAAYVPVTREEFEAARAALARPEQLYSNTIAHLAAVIAGTRTYAEMAGAIARERQPDLLAVYFEAIDTVSHLFGRDKVRGPQAIARAYRDADALIGRIAGLVSPDTLILVCSDHGFYPLGSPIDADPSSLTGPATAWHRPYGIVALAEAASLRAAPAAPAAPVAPVAPAAPATPAVLVAPIDIAPTVLHAAGLPIDDRMPGRVAIELLPTDVAERPVARQRFAIAPQMERPAFRPAEREPDAGIAPAQPDPAARARLQALGYVGATSTSLARVNLGEILFRKGKYAAAEREMRAVVESQPTHLAAHLWLAKSLAAQRRFTEAARVYRRAVAMPGGAREALVEAVAMASGAGLPDEASAILAAAGSADGAARATAQAIAAEARGDRSAAERGYRAALAIDPLAFDPLARLLDLAIGRRRPAAAAAAVRRAAKLAPDSPRHQALDGVARLAAGDAAGAARALQHALALAPDSPAVRLDLGRAWIAAGQPARAIEVLEVAPPSLTRAKLLGAALSSVGRWAEAARQYEAALEAAPDAPDVLNALAYARYKLGRHDEAAALLRRSLARDGNQPQARTLLREIEGSRE